MNYGIERRAHRHFAQVICFTNFIMLPSVVLVLGLTHVHAQYGSSSSSGSSGGDSLQPPHKLQLADGTTLFYKDWNAGSTSGHTFVFSPSVYLTSDCFDPQMMFFGQKGHHVVTFDRRGHGRSSQPWSGNTMDVFADNLNSLLLALDLKNIVLVGFGTGAGEVARYVGKYGSSRLTHLVLLTTVTPALGQSATNPNGIPLTNYDTNRAKILHDRSQFFEDTAIKHFGASRAGAEVSKGLLDGYWFEAMQGGIKAEYDTIAAYSEFDFTADIKKIDKPTLILHAGDNQITPAEITGIPSSKIIANSVLKVYPGYPHGMNQLYPDVINQDILDFFNSH